MSRKKRLNDKQLEQFRQTLPEYRRFETYQFLTLRWDIVKALFLIQQDGRKPDLLAVSSSAKAFGFDRPPQLVGERDGKLIYDSGLFHVNLETVMSDQVDLDRPIILAQVKLEDHRDPHVVLIDGLHRLYKATKQGRETLPCFILSPEEEQSCRI